MFFLSLQDPNYSIKGSRDPLGLQGVWQKAGRLIIPHLSTVSSNLIDYQILSMAFACKQHYNIPEEQFEGFFLKFEQIMAYTRYAKDSSEGFNGIDKVRKRMDSSTSVLKIGLGAEESLLSNQKSYGIWGKYNRPFSEMGLKKNDELLRLTILKIEQLPSLIAVIERILKKGFYENVEVKLEQLEEWSPLLDPPKGSLKKIYSTYLLQDKYQRELFNLLDYNDDWRHLSFYDRINWLKEKSSNSEFTTALNIIEQTERTISPLNRIFRYIQTRSYWTTDEIIKSTFIALSKNQSDTTLLVDESRELAELHNLDNLDLIKGLISRNTTISERRNGSPWISLENETIEVNHFEGANTNTGYEHTVHNDFTYFFDSYLALKISLQ